ncbi:MAG TPA: restriction endonuclease subunit S [bacterium]|nr:restriction endonuclease subunit S [bacterium]
MTVNQLPKGEVLSLPKGWEVKKLGEICIVIAGQSPEGKYYNNEGKGRPFYQGKKEFNEKYLGNPTTWTTKTTKEADENDILMSVRAPVGPVNFSTQNICIGRGLAAIRAGCLIDKEFLFNFLLKHEVEIVGNTGAVFNSINKAQIEAISIPLPPLPEQKRIVSILDNAFESVSIAKNNAEKNLKNARELFDSYLQSVFAHPGEDWEEKKLGEVTSKIGSGATPRGGNESYKTEGISLIRSMNVHDRYFKEKNLAFIDEKQAKDLNNVTIEEKDVLFNITGASVTRCCVMSKEYLPARVNQHVSIIRARHDVINATFLNLLLTSKPYKDKLLFTGEQGATRQAITKVQLQNFIISFPKSLSEQQSIVEKLDALFAETKKLEAIYQKKLDDLDELKKSILDKAFKGEL